MKKICKSCIPIIIILIIIIGAVSFKVGFNIGGAKYKEIIDYHFPIPKEISRIEGKIAEIKDNIISVETIAEDPYILPNKWKTKIFKVTITNETGITKFDNETGGLTEMQFSEIKPGDEIIAKAGENVKDKTEFTANYIRIYSVL